LSTCNLQRIEKGALDIDKFSYFQSLYFDENNFTEVDRDFFIGVNVKNVLSMRYSNIQEIKAKAFKGHSVDHLFLDGNNLFNQTARNAFVGLDVLDLHLENSNLTTLKRGFLKNIRIRRHLYLQENHITIIRNRTFLELNEVKNIHLQRNNISRIIGEPFLLLNKLRKLYLNYNQLKDDSSQFVNNMVLLDTLDISHNMFTQLPNVSRLVNLRKFYASHNFFSHVDNNTFITNYSKLENLRLSANKNLTSIAKDALDTKNLRILDVSFTSLAHLPSLQSLQSLQELKVDNTEITTLPEDICETASELKIIEAHYNQIHTLPDLSECRFLSVVVLHHNKLRQINESTFSHLSHLNTLFLDHNEIKSIHPNAFSDLTSLTVLDLSYNEILELPLPIFNNLTNLQILLLRDNKISSLPKNIFKNLLYLEELKLQNNDIATVGDVIFPPNMTWMQYLDISNNTKITTFPLPVKGFPFLYTLKMSNLPKLFDVPAIYDIPNIVTINFTYPYHCCMFEDYLKKNITFPPRRTVQNGGKYDIVLTRPTSGSAEFPFHIVNNTLKVNPLDPSNHNIPLSIIREMLADFINTYNVTITLAEDGNIQLVSNVDGKEVGELDEDTITILKNVLPEFTLSPTVNCYPLPNVLSPCANLLDPDPLPYLTWIIWFVAVVSNIAVLFIMFVSKEKLHVPQLFICNLAFADFLLGVYLAFLGGVDLKTRGQSFYKSALQWQMGPGCDSAGFIAIFSSELSVFVLTIMTLERFHTIAYSFKHGSIKKRYASVALIICWIFAGIIAVLPILDVNTYSAVAVCMPFRIDSIKDKIYIAFILTLNLTAFLIILVCYLRILCIFCKSTPAQSGKKEKIVISLKMGALVMTNLCCWLPLSVVGYAALTEHEIIDYTTAKFFIVLIFPINACLNPFIYTIFTKQFVYRVRRIWKRTDNQLQSINPSNSFRLSVRRNSVLSGSDNASACRTSSPRCDINYDFVAKRQSQRSFSVQMVPASPQLPLSIHPAPYLGRRYSSPAIFGDSGISLDITSEPSRLPSEPTLLDLPEDNTVPKGISSPMEIHRHSNLSIVQEESDYESDKEESWPISGGNSLDILRKPKLHRSRVVDAEFHNRHLHSGNSYSSPLHSNNTSQLVQALILGPSNQSNELHRLSSSTADSTNVEILSNSYKIVNPHFTRPSKSTTETSV
jgi:leucine-rich repeat-containing G protein-coupled receptor 6